MRIYTLGAGLRVSFHESRVGRLQQLAAARRAHRGGPLVVRDVAEAILLKRRWLMCRERRRPDLYAPLTAEPPVLLQGAQLGSSGKGEAVRPVGLAAD